jgi:hypothetical protein
MRTIVINRQKHITLLADHRTDPITKVLLKVGDEVVACAGCKTVFLADVWKNGINETCCFCGGTKTMDKIPNDENITFSKPKSQPFNGTFNAAPVKEGSYAGAAFIFALIAFGVGVYAYNLKNEIEQKQEEKTALESRIESLSNEYNVLQTKMGVLQYEKDKLSARYTDHVKTVTSISMVGGIKVADSGNYAYEYGSPINTEKVVFSVNQPILLKSVKVLSSSSGYLKLKIYNNVHAEVAETNLNYITEGVNTIRFNNANLSTGRDYYITVFQADTKLLYLKNFNAYPVSSNNLLDITGTSDYTDLYLYYFDWEYTLQSNAVE